MSLVVAWHEVDSFQTIYLNEVSLRLEGSGNVTAPANYYLIFRF